MNQGVTYSCHIGVCNRGDKQNEMFFKEVKLPFEPTVNYVLKISGLLLVIDNIIFDVDRQIFAVMMHPTDIDQETAKKLESEGWVKVLNQ